MYIKETFNKYSSLSEPSYFSQSYLKTLYFIFKSHSHSHRVPQLSAEKLEFMVDKIKEDTEIQTVVVITAGCHNCLKFEFLT